MALGLREHFLLRDDVVFLNHGSFGACPRPIFEDYQFWQLELEKQPVEFMDQHRRSLKLIRNVREQLGAFVGSHPNNLVGVINATTGLNIVARSLPLQEGDEILTTDHEYGALEKTWTFIARKTGAKYIHADVPLPLASAAEFTEAIWSKVTPKTKVLFLSHLTSATALTFPIEELIQRAKKNGIWTVIDGAHAPGHIPLQLDALDAHRAVALNVERAGGCVVSATRESDRARLLRFIQWMNDTIAFKSPPTLTVFAHSRIGPVAHQYIKELVEKHERKYSYAAKMAASFVIAAKFVASRRTTTTANAAGDTPVAQLAALHRQCRQQARQQDQFDVGGKAEFLDWEAVQRVRVAAEKARRAEVVGRLHGWAAELQEQAKPGQRLATSAQIRRKSGAHLS